MQEVKPIAEERWICACCGAIIRPDWIIDDVICPTCSDKIFGRELSWCDAIFERLIERP